jgi:mannose-6-phosphate isomerase-like protein (cupin superfamily)
MKISPTAALVAVTAFGAGFGAARLTAPAGAQPVPIAAQVIDVDTVAVDKYKSVLNEAGANIAIQTGTVPKHYHNATDEVQYIVAGSGTEWLGGRQVDIKPGTLLVIPRGTVHGGQIVASGDLRLISIHTPTQPPGDTYPVP